MSALPPLSCNDGDERAERERVLRTHAYYEANDYYRRIWGESPACGFMLETKWRMIERVLRDARVEFGSARVLDVGGGGGEGCARFRALGFGPERVVGLDLNGEFLRQARARHPWMLLVEGNAARLPFADGAFDLVFQSTLVSSVLDPGIRARVLAEVRRVLVPGGLFLSYDMRYPNPWNRFTRPLRLSEIRRAFAGWPLQSWTLTALPPLLRLAARISLRACRLLDAVPFLRSHVLTLARRP